MAPLRTRRSRAPAAWAVLSLAVLVSLAIALPATGAAAAPVTWLARVGTAGTNGQAAITAPDAAGTVGSLKLSLKGLSASTTYPVKVQKGTCAKPGSVLFTAPSQKSSTAGKISKVVTIPAAKMDAIRSATPLILRVGSGSKLRCGPFTGGPAPTPTPTPTPSPTPVPPPSPIVTVTLEAGPYVSGISATPTAVWVGSVWNNSLVRFDPTTNQQAGMTNLGPLFESMPYAIDATADAVWVTTNTIEQSTSAPGTGKVKRIDPKTGAVLATLDVGARPFGVAIGQSAVWVSSAYTGLIYKIDPATNTVLSSARPAIQPVGLDAADGSLWIADAGGKAVVRVKETTGEILATIPVSSYAWEVSVGAGAVWAVVGDPDIRGLDQLVRIDPRTNTVVTSIKLDGEPWDVAAGDNAIWVANEGSKDAVWIDPATNAVGGRVPVGNEPRWVSATGRSAWYIVGDQDRDQIVRIDY